jgi:hypothetical protein
LLQLWGGVVAKDGMEGGLQRSREVGGGGHAATKVAKGADANRHRRRTTRLGRAARRRLSRRPWLPSHPRLRCPPCGSHHQPAERLDEIRLLEIDAHA